MHDRIGPGLARIIALLDPLKLRFTARPSTQADRGVIGTKAQDPRHLPVGPESPPGCSGQDGYGSLRHASSVDWFVA